MSRRPGTTPRLAGSSVQPRYKERARANTTDDKHCQPLGYKYIPCVVFACVIQVWACGCIGTTLHPLSQLFSNVSMTIPEHPVTLRLDICTACG